MNQAAIGRFIAELRHEQNLTQAELAERLCVTNKTVSRWECGNYLPDIAIMPELAAELGVTLSELFAGERFPAEDYQHSADTSLLNIMNCLKEIRDIKSYRQITSAIAEIGMCIIMGHVAYDILQPPLHNIGKVIIYGAIFVLLGLLCQSLRRKGKISAPNIGKRLLIIASYMILIAICWAVHNSYVMLPLLIFAIIMLLIGSVSDNKYFAAIDELLSESDTKKPL